MPKSGNTHSNPSHQTQDLLWVGLFKPPIKHEMGFELLTGRLTNSNPSHRTQDLPRDGRHMAEEGFTALRTEKKRKLARPSLTFAPPIFHWDRLSLVKGAHTWHGKQSLHQGQAVDGKRYMHTHY